MASIHRRPDTKYYFAAWRGQGGRLFLRSTKQTDRSKAQTVALAFERAAQAGMRGELTENQCRKVLNDILDQTNSGEQFRTPGIADWLKEWLAGKEDNRSAATAERYRVVIEGFVDHLGDRAERPLGSLISRDIQGFLTKRHKEGCSPSTVQLDGKILRTALNAARKQGLIQTNAAEAVELPDRASVERGTFTPAEISILVNTAEGEWKTLIIVGYYTGARLSDCCRMRWTGDRVKDRQHEGVDFTNDTLTYWQQKTQKLITVPIHPDLRAQLDTLASTDKPEIFIMPEMAGKGPGGRHGLSESFKNIVRKAGLDLGTVQGGGKRKISRRTFHALRHSFTSALANANVSAEHRMRLTGHSSEAVHKLYTHHDIHILRDAILKMPSALSKPKI